jgi:hypothetical protein
MKNRSTIFFVILIIAIVGLLFWARAASEPKEVANMNFPGTEIQCLTFGHQNLAQHFHPSLGISVDGTHESIPTDIGITENCMAEVHTHDASGELHIESVVRGKTFNIFDFFAVRGESIEREGYTYQMFVNGNEVDPATYIFSDLDRVEIRYTSDGSEPVEGSQQSDVQFNLEI